MKVDYIDHMGSDLTVVNAARVSFDKESAMIIDDTDAEMVLSEKDQKLISYLAKHNHWTPFGHCQATVRVKAPIFVARQLGKHQVGMVWNEVSRRYVDSEPEFYTPTEWRKRSDSAKQGSSDETVYIESMPDGRYFDGKIREIGPITLSAVCLNMYDHLLNQGVCPEQARMVLPQSMYTEWYWTGSLAAWARVCNLRLDPHTQKETQVIATLISGIMFSLFPHSWQALCLEKHGS